MRLLLQVLWGAGTSLLASAADQLLPSTSSDLRVESGTYVESGF